jgi:uncharacterized protein YcfL
MKTIVVSAVALMMLAGCSNDAETARAPSQFQSIGDCEPTAWAGMEQESRSLPDAQRQRVQQLLQDAQSFYAEDNRGQCIYTLQQAERIVRGGAS